MEKIDFVITWVNGSDPKWREERSKFVTEEERKKDDVAGDKRYKDNGLLRYWFRGVEKFAPWVNKIYFVTWGHIPEWLDTSNEKLVIVKHSDFLKPEYTPTFNSACLNLNLHRIKGLSEQFVYFNDDMFLLRPVKETLFFKKGLPRDMAVEDVIPAKEGAAFWHMIYNDIILTNKNYNKKLAKKGNFFKWYNFSYGRQMMKNVFLSKIAMLVGIYETHLPAGYLKSMYEKIWERDFETLDKVCRHKFRTHQGNSENYIRYCTLMEGKFYPLNKMKHGRYCSMTASRLEGYITSGKFDYVCINDEVEGAKYNQTVSAFETILPEKSGFEI